MKAHRIVIALLALIVVVPTQKTRGQEARAGTFVRTVAPRGMLGVATEPVPAKSLTARQRVVTDVVPGSPADKAGVVKGDTIVRINGLAATQQVLSSPFEPGDTVVLRVRRNGRERDVKVVAAQRPEATTYSIEALPSDVHDRVRIIMDNVLINADSVRAPMMRIEKLVGDSTVIIFGRDTIRASGAFHLPRGAARPLLIDSLRARHFMSDSVIRFMTRADSGFFALRVGSDSMRFRPAEIMHSMAVGLRAVAGAELTELNPELGEFFGTARGVLVLNARDGTPAARAGLRGGDVILRANGTEVRNITELRRAIEAAGNGNAVQLRVLRRGQNVDITLGKE